MNINLPEKLKPIFEPHRHKIIYGGRGSAKSHTVAKFLILKASESKVRILCFRQLQNSITDSVHKLLCEQIELMGLLNFFHITKTQIIGKNGSEFIFKGILHSVSEIKSTEGIDYAWGEESEQITENSWNVIAPTIRKANSEIIMTFNTRFKQDFIYNYFIVNEPPPDSLIIKINFEDNPWFPDVLRVQMEHMKETDIQAYIHIWKGELKKISTGAVFGKQLATLMDEKRVLNIPIQANSVVNVYSDLGKSDETALWFVQKVGMETRLIDYYENRLQDVDHYARYIKESGYNIGTLYLPHDADHDRLGMTRNINQQFMDSGLKTEVVDRIAHKQTAIELARELLSTCYFHSNNTDRGLRVESGFEKLSAYRFKFNDLNGVYKLTPLHDKNSNCADAFQCLAQAKVLNTMDKYSDWNVAIND